MTTALTNAQRATLKAAILVNPTAAALRTAGDTVALRAWCNAEKLPAAMAWRTDAPVLDVEEAPSYTTYDTLATGKRDSWALFLRAPRDFTRGKVRAWVVDVWGVASAAGSNSTAILQAATVNATNAQAAIGGTAKATGSGAGEVSALDLGYSGLVTQADVDWLINN